MTANMENIATVIGQKAATFGGGATVGAGILAYKDTIPLYIAMAGGTVAVLGFLTSFFFQIRRDLREQKQADLREKMMLKEDRRKEEIADFALKRRSTDYED